MLGKVVRSANVQGEVTERRTPKMEAKLEIRESQTAKISKMGSCMVCGLKLERRDDVVWCRHCGRLAHRIHLMEWIQAKKRCPACNENLDERYYR